MVAHGLIIKFVALKSATKYIRRRTYECKPQPSFHALRRLNVGHTFHFMH